MPDIFLSYSRDDQATARRFAEGFEREGFSVWWDATLNPGEAYDQVTEKALREAKAVVVLWSKTSVDSRWVRAEATTADRNKTLVPVMIEPCLRPIMFELTHTADLSNWKGDKNDKAWQSYVAGVRLFVARGEPVAAAIPAASGSRGNASPFLARFRGIGRGKQIIAVSLVVLALLVIAGAVQWTLTRTTGKPVTTATVATPSAAAPAAPRTAIAVMPFANLTGDASKDYLGDGMSEELINVLAMVPGLKVPARTSSFAYKGRNTDIRQIAKDLSVGTILEGSVRSAGTTIRVTAQLINAQDGLHLWSATYDRKFSDLFKLQDDLAKAIVQALQVKLNGASPESVMQAPPTQDVEAYNLTMQGFSLLDRVTPERANRAAQLFDDAIARDSKYAHAHAGSAWSHFIKGRFFEGGDSEFRLAISAAQTALSLDPNDGEAHTVMGTIEFRRSYVAAEAHWRAALRGAPGDARSHGLYVFQLFFVGHIREALEQARKAYELAPASSFALNRLSMALSAKGMDVEALRFADRAIDVGQLKPDLQHVYGMAALRAKKYAQAAEFLSTDSVTVDARRFGELIRLVAAALAGPGRRSAALAASDRLFPGDGVHSSGSDDVSQQNECAFAAYGLSLLGDQDVAYALANRCLDASKQPLLGVDVANLIFLWTPELQPFRRDPRFHAYAARMGDLMEYWKMYGPPDDCDLKDGKLSCR